MDELLERYLAFRGQVERFREGSDRPDPQLRAAYDSWMSAMEWKDARAAFSLYCRLNRTLHSPFVEELVRRAQARGAALSGTAMEFRGEDVVRTIGSWMLGTPVPSGYEAVVEKGAVRLVIPLLRLERLETRYLLLNPPEEEVLSALRAFLSAVDAG